MLVHGLRAAHLAVRVAWLAGTATLLALIVLPAALSALGHQVYIVRGASMEPAIPLGSVIVVRPVDPASVQVGEIVTYRLPQGTVVTHRVTAVTDEGGLAFQTKGDASLSADPSPIPASAIVGGLEYTMPVVGYLMYLLGSPPGAIVAVALLGVLLLLGWSVGRLIRSVSGAPPRPSVRLAP